MLRKLFGGGKAGGKEEKLPPLSPAVAAAVMSTVGAKGVPPMHGAAQRAFQLSTDPNAEAHDFVEIIGADEALSARVMKVANSVFFDRGKRSTSIDEAVLVIGIEELRCLLNATTLCELFPSRNPLRTQFWINDLATALLSRKFAQRLLPQQAEAAFLGGLMHDIGKLLLVQRAADLYAKVQRRVESSACSYAEAEGQEFAFDHTEAGQLVGERWKFSESLIDVIRNHHRPWCESDRSATQPLSLATLVKCSDIVAHALGIGHPRNLHRLRSHYEEQLDAALAVLRLDPARKRESLPLLQREIEGALELYQQAAGERDTL